MESLTLTIPVRIHLLRHHSKFYLEIDVSQQIGQIDFTQFCILYTPEGILSVHGDAGQQSLKQKRVLETSSSTVITVTPAPKKLSDGKINFWSLRNNAFRFLQMRAEAVAES